MADNSKPSAPKVGQYRVILDNSPFTMEGKTFSYGQIMRALEERTFRPGMKFRLSPGQTEFVLTAQGLTRFQHGKAIKAKMRNRLLPAAQPIAENSTGRNEREVEMKVVLHQTLITLPHWPASASRTAIEADVAELVRVAHATEIARRRSQPGAAPLTATQISLRYVANPERVYVRSPIEHVVWHVRQGKQVLVFWKEEEG